MEDLIVQTLLRGSRLVVFGVLALAAVLQAQPASAGIIWCRADPTVALNGTEVQIWVAMPAEYQLSVGGPIRVTVKTPEGSARQLLRTDAGFNGYGEAVSFASSGDGDVNDGSFSIQVWVSVPAGGGTDIPIQVQIAPANGDTIWDSGTNGGLRVKARVVGSL
jgi:hypothetical protein